MGFVVLEWKYNVGTRVLSQNRIFVLVRVRTRALIHTHPNSYLYVILR